MSQELLTLFSTTNIIIFIIVLTRLSGFLTSAPMFSTYPIPTQIKVWLCATVAFLIYPFLISKGSFVVPNSIPVLTCYLALEFAIGLLLGFVANIVFVGIQLSGHVISTQMGLSIADALDPTTGTNAPIVGTLYVYIASFVFLSLNADHYLFEAIYQSFTSIPPGHEFIFNPDFVHQIILLVTSLFEIAVKVVIPIFAIMFSLEVLMAVVAKMMPQMNIFMVSLPFKIIVGLILLLIFLSPTVSYITTLIEEYLNHITHLLLT